MTTIEQLEQLEQACRDAYESQDGQTRARAERACLELAESLQGVQTSRALLARATSHYSQLVALAALSKAVTSCSNTGGAGAGGVESGLSVPDRLEIRNVCLNELLRREGGLAEYVGRAAVGLVCKITKLGWLDTAPGGEGDPDDLCDSQNQAGSPGEAMSDSGPLCLSSGAPGSTAHNTGPGSQKFVFRELLPPLLEMLKSGQPIPMLVATQILHGLVFEFNQSYEGEITRSTIVMRKIANNFREQHLFGIFTASIELLGKMSASIKSLNLYDSTQHSIVQYSLKLTLACLSYDFIGTCGGEEVSDDMMSVQVPTTWRQAFLSPLSAATGNSDALPDPVPLLFNLYDSLPPSLAHLTLACLVQTASFRRSFFNNAERQVFLGQLVNGVCDIFSRDTVATTGAMGGAIGGGGRGLQDPSCYHELCRLVCRLKSNFQLGELVSLQSYGRFIELLARFTVRSLDSGDCTDSSHSNSQHYLLLTWQRLVGSLPYLRCTQQPHMLDTHCPAVLDAYVRSRLSAVTRTSSGLDPGDHRRSSSNTNNNSNNADSDSENAVGSSAGGGGEWEDIEDPVSAPQELESVAVLSRCQYSVTVSRLAALFDQVTGETQGMGVNGAVSRLRRLAWLVLLMGACVSGRVGCVSGGSSGGSGGSTLADDNDRLDGELVARVLRLAGSIDPSQYSVLNNNPGARDKIRGPNRQYLLLLHSLAQLESAIVSFLDQIRRVYLCGESCVRAARLYDVLQATLSIPDDSALLDTLVHKILVNLRVWAGLSRLVINRSLALLHELSLGAVAKRLIKLPVVQSLLEDHSPERLPFLLASCRDPRETAFGQPDQYSSSQRGSSHHNQSMNIDRGAPLQLSAGVSGASSNARTCFYASLTRLFLLSPRADETAVFLEFMAPLSAACDSVSLSLSSMSSGYMSQSAAASHEAQTHAKLALLALLRDVRGVATACHSKASFQSLFEWLYPAVLTHLIIAIDLWGPTEPLGLSLGCLKLAGELSLSRNNRLQPQVASPSGELMFRVCSRILICYGDKNTQERLMSIRSSKSQYLLYIKEVTACIDILRNLLTGNYVNLGAFALYADDSLEKCLHMFLQLMVSIPPDDLMAYPKLARSYYCLADSLTQDHLIWLGTQRPEMVLYFVNTICDGLTSTSLAVSSSCCSSLDNVASFLLRLAQSRQLGARPAPRPGAPLVTGGAASLSPAVRQSIDQFLLTSRHLSGREAESRDNYCRLMGDPGDCGDPGDSGEARAGPLAGILARGMDALFQALVQPECKNQWAMSRPLLGLILLNTKAFEDLRQCYVLASAGAGAHDSVRHSFERLMEDVNCSLSIRNRDKFTQNLNTFRHNLNGSSKLSIDQYHSSSSQSVEMIA